VHKGKVPFLVKGLESLAVIAMFVVALFVFAQIVLRNLGAVVPVWLDEGARLAHVVMVYLIVPILFREGLHLAVDTFIKLFPKKIQKVAGLFTLLCCFLFGVFFLYSSYDLLWVKGIWSVPTPAILMPSFFLYLGPILGVTLSLVFIYERIWLLFTKKEE